MSDVKAQFSLIYDQYIERIYRFVYLKVSLKETAEDITSKVFTKAWEAYQKDSQSIQNMSAFLYRIARNMTVDHYRQKDRTKTVSFDNVPQVADHKTDIHQKAVINSELEQVKAALANIKEDYQDVIIWHYLEDMPTEQIAQLLGRPAGTVRVMLHRGLEMLKNELNREA